MSHRAVREMVKLAEAEGLIVQATGITGSTHIWLDLVHPQCPDEKRRFHCAFSTSDQRTMKNNRAMFRRFQRDPRAEPHR